MKYSFENGFSPVIVVFGVVMLIAAGLIVVNRNEIPSAPNVVVEQNETQQTASPSASLIATSSATAKSSSKPIATQAPVKSNPTAKPTLIPTNAPASSPNSEEEQKKKEEMIKEAMKNKTPYPISDQDKQLILNQNGQ